MNVGDKDIQYIHRIALSVNEEQQNKDLIKYCLHVSEENLSVDIGGPYRPGIPLTDRIAAKHQWPRYMLVGAFIPFSEKEARARAMKKR